MLGRYSGSCSLTKAYCISKSIAVFLQDTYCKEYERDHIYMYKVWITGKHKCASTSLILIFVSETELAAHWTVALLSASCGPPAPPCYTCYFLTYSAFPPSASS